MEEEKVMAIKNEVILRREIVKICKRMYERGYLVATDGNVSAKLGLDFLLTTPAGLCKGFLTPEEVVKTNWEGEGVVGEKLKPSSEILMHLAIYRKRREVEAIVHAHPPFATGFAVAGISLEACILPEVILTLGSVPLTPYATPSTEELPEKIEEYIKDYDALLLANHGAVTVGKDLFDAFYKMERLEHFAKVSLMARILGKERLLSQEEVAKLAEVRERLGIDGRPLRCKTCPYFPQKEEFFPLERIVSQVIKEMSLEPTQTQIEDE